jgi:Ion channel
MIGQRLLSRSPWVYAGIYFVVFVVFGLTFRAFPGDFYHATAAFEPAIHADRDRLRDELTAALRAQFRHAHGGTALFQTWRINADDLDVLDVESQEDGLSFDLRYVIHEGTDSKHDRMQAVWKSKVTLPKRANRITLFGQAGPVTYIFPRVEPSDTVGLPPSLGTVIVSVLLPADQRGFAPGQPVVILQPALFNRVNAYWAAVHGFPGTSTGEWARMFYLSAATITTLGFGDVVPLTSTARLLVGLEALLGVAIIGLFLNACAAAHQPPHV